MTVRWCLWEKKKMDFMECGFLYEDFKQWGRENKKRNTKDQQNEAMGEKLKSGQHFFLLFFKTYTEVMKGEPYVLEPGETSVDFLHGLLFRKE